MSIEETYAVIMKHAAALGYNDPYIVLFRPDVGGSHGAGLFKCRTDSCAEIRIGKGPSLLEALIKLEANVIHRCKDMAEALDSVLHE